MPWLVGVGDEPREPLAAAGGAVGPAAPLAAARQVLADSRFLPNLGQWPAAVRYAVTGDGTAWLHDDGFTVRLERWSPAAAAAAPAAPAEGTGAVVRMRFLGGAASAWRAAAPTAGRAHFLRGSDAAAHRRDVPVHSAATAVGVLPGIDIVYRPPRGPAGPLAYDLELTPGADLAAVQVRCEGIAALAVDAEGRLRLRVPTADGEVELVHDAPVAWQDTPTGRQALPVRFRQIDATTYGFAAVDLDPAFAATVDPGVVWSTYLGGGSSDSASAVRWIPGSGVWVAGWAGSLDFPTTPGAYRTTGGRDGFVARLSDDGTQLQFATYLGGALGDEVRGLDLGPGGTPTVVGFTRSVDFPVTAGAFQPAFGGASPVLDLGDAFVARLSADGSSLLGATYLGGFFDESAEGVAVDAQGFAVVAGWTASNNFPTTPGSFQPALGGPLTLQTDGFVARIAPDARTASWSTYLGGQLPDQLLAVAVDPATGDAVAAGWSVSANYPTTAQAYRTTSLGGVEMVVSRLASNGASLVFSTFLGGIDTDVANSIAVASDGTLWLGGMTRSPNFPTSANAPQRQHAGRDDGVVARLAGNGQLLPYATLLGGPGADQVRNVKVVGTDVLAVGECGDGFPVTANAAQPLFGGGSLDAFVAHLGNSGAARSYVSYVGGSATESLVSIDLKANGLAVLGGFSFAADFPVTPGAYQTQRRGSEDAVVLQFDLSTDLGDGLAVGAPGGGPTLLSIGGGGHEALAIEVENLTDRELVLDSLRVLLAGRGLGPQQLADLEVRLAQPGSTEPGTLVAGPLAVSVENAEQLLPLHDCRLPARQRRVLRLRLRVDPTAAAGATVEVAAAVVESAAFGLRAPGAGTGPAVRVLGSGRVAGPVLMAGALPGDLDRDGRLTVADLRRLCAAQGAPAPAADCDGDGRASAADAALALQLLLDRPALAGAAPFLARDRWCTLVGVFPFERTVEVVLGGRSVVMGRVTPRELTFRTEANQAIGLQELTVAVDGQVVLTRTVQVQ